jgi:alpha-beta hydrolase superfamily lysophospholipase
MTNPVRGWRLLLLVGLVALTPGCVTDKVAHMIAAAPNRQHVPAIMRNQAYREKYDALYAEAWLVPVGPPSAEISVATLEPGDYHFHYEIVFKELGNGHQSFSAKHDWLAPNPQLPRAKTVKGTIVVIPGYQETKEDVVHWGLRLAEAGYRAVLMDLRGQGRSTGPWLGYGSFEVPDLRQVLDDLQARGLAGGEVGVLGISYGASMSLLWAAQDPRVGAVVALEPFSSAREAPREFGRALMPKLSAMVSDAQFARAEDEAARLGGFAWKDGEVLAAVEYLSTPVMYIHGGGDTWISPEHTRQLYAHTAGPKRLGIIDHDNHVLLALRLDPIDREVLAWFAQWLPRP